MEGWNTYQTALESSRTSSGTADEKYAAVMDSIATSMQRIQTAWEGFTQKLKASGFVKGFFETIAGIVENVDKILPNIVAMLTAIAGKHLPTIGMKVQGLFSGGSRMGKGIRAAFGRSGSFEQESLKELAEYKKGLGYKDDELSEAERKALGSGQQENTADNKTASNTDQIKSDVSAIKAYLQNKKAEGTTTPNTGDDTNQNVEAGGGQKGKVKGTKFLKKAKIASGITTGIASGLSSGMTANYGDFTSTADKIFTGAASGIFASVLTALAGPIGGIIGTAIGQLGGKIFYNEFHKEEIARRARVDEAKKQLEATQKVESAIISAEELISKDRSEWGVEEYKQEKEYRAQMLEALGESSSLYDNFKKLGGEIKGELTQEVVALYKSAQLMTEAQETYKSKEEERYDLLNKVNSAEYSLIQYIQSDPLNLKLRTQYEQKYNKTVEQGAAQFEQLNIKLETINDNLHEGILASAFYSGGFSSYTSSDLRSVSLERIAVELARQWAIEDPNANIFDENGNIYKSAYDAAVAELKTHEEYNVITKKQSYNLADAIENEDWLKQFYKDGISDYNELYQFINTQDKDKIKDFLGAVTYEDAKYIIDKINKSNPENIANIAHGLNLTEEQAKGLKDLIGFVTLGDVMSSNTDFLDKFETLGNIFSDLSEDSELTAENIKKIISTYPELLQGEDGSISQSNIIKNIVSLLSDPSAGYGLVYAGKVAESAKTDTSLWSIFQNRAKDLGLGIDVLTKIQNAKDYSSAGIQWTDQLTNEWATIVSQYSSTLSEYVEEYRDKIIEYENKLLDKQIENLQSIKDQLSSINEQRKKELDLIKARDALENAKKEKKLVYRAGIGFVAQADTSAIQEAQDKIDELERQQTEEDLQYQIDQLNQQKAILEAIQNNESLNKLANTVEQIKKGLSIDEGHSNIIDALQKMSSQEYADKIRENIEKSVKENTNTSTEEAKKQTGGEGLGVNDPETKKTEITSDNDENIAVLKLIQTTGYTRSGGYVVKYGTSAATGLYNTKTKEVYMGYDNVPYDTYEEAVKSFKTKGITIPSNATGSYDYSGGKTYVNELGTEAIVTPQGTLTSLPSHSGIVPADLTKNLFSLGEIAPNLIATLRNQMPNVSKSNSTSNDNSTNIGTVYATFNADSGFDMNKFMIDLRSAAGNTRHNN